MQYPDHTFLCIFEILHLLVFEINFAFEILSGIIKFYIKFKNSQFLSNTYFCIRNTLHVFEKLLSVYEITFLE